MQNQRTDKEAGYWSEAIGQLNPANIVGGTHIGAASALATPTRDTEEQAESDQSVWKNLLVPGVAGYNAAKRLGYSIRNPDLKAEDLDAQIEQLENALVELKAEKAEGDNGEGKEVEAAQKIALFIGDTTELLYELGQERDFLREKVAILEKQGDCEQHSYSGEGPCPDCDEPVKQVEASYASGPEREVVETTVDHLVDAQFLKQADRDQAVTAILDDPATALLSFCDKLAVRRCESEAAVMPKLGHAVDGILESDSAPSRESDKAFEHRFNALS